MRSSKYTILLRKRRLADLAETLWFQLRPLALNVSRLISGEDSLLRGEQYVIVRRHLYLPPPGGGGLPGASLPVAASHFGVPVFYEGVCLSYLSAEPRGLLAQPAS